MIKIKDKGKSYVTGIVNHSTITIRECYFGRFDFIVTIKHV